MTEPPRHYRIDTDRPGIIEEQVAHRVMPITMPLSFYLKFHKRDDTNADPWHA